MLGGKRIIVTGAARGIGAAVMRACVGQGANVVAMDVRDEMGSEEAREEGAHYLRCDVADQTSVDRSMREAIAHLGGLEGLAHVAAIEHTKPAADLDVEDWQRVMNVNALGTMLINRAAFLAMRLAGGSIVNFASIDGIRGRAGGAYCAASKGAVLAWTRTVADEWGVHGVRVNAVAPVAMTPMMLEWQEAMGPGTAELVEDFFAKEIPLGGKPGDPDRDIAPVVTFLMSDQARFVTGQTIPIDGGRCKVS